MSRKDLGVAQLVARYLGVVEAASSSLVTQTKIGGSIEPPIFLYFTGFSGFWLDLQPRNYLQKFTLNNVRFFALTTCLTTCGDFCLIFDHKKCKWLVFLFDMNYILRRFRNQTTNLFSIYLEINIKCINFLHYAFYSNIIKNKFNFYRISNF